MFGSIKWVIGNWRMLLVILALASFTVLGVYLKGRADGIAHVTTRINSEQLNNAIETKKESDNVAKEEQSKTITDIDHGLCRLGIMRSNSGC